jgi:hypothetical protein
MSDNEKLVNFLIALGGLVGLIEAIVGLFFPRWFQWVGAIFGIIFSLITLLSITAPQIPTVNWFFSLDERIRLLYIILGILLIIFGSTIGGVIVILAIIVDFFLEFF